MKTDITTRPAFISILSPFSEFFRWE